MTRAALAAGALALILGVGGIALAARGYSDPAGDVNTAPDIVALEVSEQASGVLRIVLTVGNFQTLPENSWINLWFDTDSDLDTGAEGDEALVRYTARGDVEAYRWNGVVLMEAATDGVSGRFADGVLTMSIPRAAIGATAPFGLLAVTSRGQPVGDRQLIASDFAPDAGRLTFGGSPTARVTDPPGDNDAAPDITAVRATDARTGWITFSITTPNYAVLPEASAVVVTIDADANPRTGDSGAEIQIAVAAGEIAMERWNGRQWVPDDLPTRARFRNAANVLSIDVHVSELGTTSRLAFSLLAAKVNTAIQGIVALDVAPDDLSRWIYPLVYKPALTLSTSRVTSAPSRPRAGRRVTMSMAVRRSDTGRPIASGAVSCAVRVAGRAVPARGSVSRGAARCALVVPPAARGSRLNGTITVRSGGARVTRAFTFVVG